MFGKLTRCLCITLSVYLPLNAYAQQTVQDQAVAYWNFEQSFKSKTGELTFKVYEKKNQTAVDAITTHKVQTDEPASITIKPNHFLRLTGSRNKSVMLCDEQTVWVRIKPSDSPHGLIWSRHRPQDGLRGIELGLTAKQGWNADGPLPCVTVSEGDRHHTVFLISDQPLQAGTWYDLFVIFKPSQSIELLVIESQTGMLVTRKIATKKIPTKINSKGGENILTLGARRYSSVKNDDFISANSHYAGFGIWDHVLNDDDISTLVGKPLSKPHAAAPRQPQTFHVNANGGSDQADGLSSQQAFASIKRATQQLIPGDTVLIAPGIYFEQVVINDAGTTEKPITIKATNSKKNAVILTLADPSIRQGKQKWELVDDKRQLYRTTLNHWPARVLYDQIGLMPYPTIDTLKAFTLFDDYPGPPNGFTYDLKEKMLYVRLDTSEKYGSTDPNDHVIAASPINAYGSNGHSFLPNRLDANLVIAGNGDGHIVIQGLTFETPGAVGVLAMRHHVTVKDSYFVGCRFGVGGRAQSSDQNRTTHYVTVDHCEYSNEPVFEDTLQVIEKYHDQPIAKKYPFFWWHRKGHNTDRTKIKNDETGILGNVGSHWVLKNSNIHNAFEGLATWGVRWANDLTITHNRFYKLVDNAIETEDHAANVTIAYNWIEDVFEPISWQPLGGTPWPGPVFIHDNVIVQSETFGKIWDKVNHVPGVFKIGASGKNWAREHMGATAVDVKHSMISKRFVAVPGEGFVVYNNTIYFPQGNLLTLPHPTYGEFTRELVNFRFFNNIFVTQKLYQRDDWQGSLMEFESNLNICLASQNQSGAIAAGKNGRVLHQIDQAGFTSSTRHIFSLQANSPAQQLGVTIKAMFEDHRPAGANWDHVKHLAP